jgi:DMSO/TMAO reductase YedYZ molybdopterin-dependent catalytic subunit
MINHWKGLLILISALGLLLSACGSSGPAALEVTGLVDTPQGWSEKELKSMDAVDAEYTGKDGSSQTYTGVVISGLLSKAGIQAGAKTVVFVGDDGYTAEVSLDEVESCQDCIAAFQEGGGLRVVMPGFSGKVQVKGLIEIRIQE